MILFHEKKKESFSPFLGAPPLKPRRKGIEFQRKNLYAKLLHADCVDDHFNVLDYCKYEDAYGGSCFDVSGSFTCFDSIDERVGYNDRLLTAFVTEKFPKERDITFLVIPNKGHYLNLSILEWYTSNLSTQHRQAIQRVLKYLKKIMDYKLMYKSWKVTPMQAGSEDNTSTSGWVFMLGGGVISWASKKQTCITGSTMEYEFVALAAAGKEAE
nr:zinc finger, CCHC-type [Tanacetum cinerariifolium]